jgi:type IV pilus assembly protein PilQ
MNVHHHKRRSLRVRIAALFLLGCWLPAVEAANLDTVTHSALPGNRVQVKLQLDADPGFDPLTFTVDNPARIAIDLPGITLATRERTHTVGIGAVEGISMVEADGRTRVVVRLVDMVPYNIERRGNAVLVTVESGTVAMKDPLPPEARGEPSVADGARPSIRNVDFRRGDAGEARVLVQLSTPNVAVNIEEQGGKILVDFPTVYLPDQFNRQLDVGDFATPARIVDTIRYGNGTRIIVTPTGEFEHLAYQTDANFTLELRPLSKEEVEAARKERLGYTGERLSLNFQDIEVRAVLQLIADFTEQNLVTSDTVGGSVTLRLKNVPWDQALDIVLKTKGLGMRKTGNVLLVAPQEELAQREKQELEARQALAELAPLRTEFVQVNYAKAGDLAALIKSEQNRLLSERGNVTIDDRTNTLLVQDTAERLADIRRVVETLDVPVRQVLIESRVVIALQTFLQDLGVRFGLSQNLEPNQRPDIGVIGGRRPGNTNFGAGTAFINEGSEGIEQYVVDLPTVLDTTPAGAIGLAVGRIGTFLLQLELQAAQAENRAETISAPRIITANQKEAIIEQGQEVPFAAFAGVGGAAIANVQFKKAVLALTAKPQITPDERIIMDLEVRRDVVNRTDPAAAGAPPIDTSRAVTQVLVDNGETVVLGGVFIATNQRGTERVPFFGDLPYIGWLFKREGRTEEKRELLIFVTPKILKESVAAG